jgi:hypothetical protein
VGGGVRRCAGRSSTSSITGVVPHAEVHPANNPGHLRGRRSSGDDCRRVGRAGSERLFEKDVLARGDRLRDEARVQRRRDADVHGIVIESHQLG